MKQWLLAATGLIAARATGSFQSDAGRPPLQTSAITKNCLAGAIRCASALRQSRCFCACAARRTTPFRWNLEDCFYDLAFANAEFA
jgi:hypothetical protein